MVKQCCYCRKTYSNEPDIVNLENPETDTGLWLVSRAQRENRVSHGICSTCFEKRIAQFEKAASA